MSDLISRSALLKYLRDYKWEFALGSDFSKAIEMVDVQPTAYDVDKVVERLEESLVFYEKKKKEAYEDKDWDEFDRYVDIIRGIYEAIEICKEVGGMNEQS